MSRFNKWRMNLDPRDPNYIDPPDDDELEDEAEAEEWQAESRHLDEQEAEVAHV